MGLLARFNKVLQLLDLSDCLWPTGCLFATSVLSVCKEEHPIFVMLAFVGVQHHLRQGTLSAITPRAELHEWHVKQHSSVELPLSHRLHRDQSSTLQHFTEN